MKKKNNIYFILTYLFFIYPPFIWGLVLIYQNQNLGKEHITSLWINLILIIVIAIVCTLLIYNKIIHLPDETERKYLLFGVIGNIVVYFYTFQNMMKIDDFVTIYLVLLIILGVHYLLISRKIMAKELWILMPIFLVLDLWYLIGTGCGFTDGYTCHNQATGAYLYVIYSLLILVSLAYYSYRLLKLNQWDVLKYLTFGLILILSVLFQNEDWMDEKFTMTIMIALPFFTIVDFIIRIVNKKYTHKMLFHYLRAYTIFLIFSVVGAFDFFYGEASYELLAIMVTVTYISLFINIFRYLLKVADPSSIRIDKGVVFEMCNESHLIKIVEQFGKEKSAFISLDSEDYSLVAVKNEMIIGFISTITKSLTEPLTSIKEASVEIIEVHPEYRKQGIATKLIEKTEKHFSNKGVHQIRAWALCDNVNYINLWSKRNYCLSPTIINFKNSDKYLDGYHFTKKL